MVILTLLAYGCYKEKQKGEINIEKDVDAEEDKSEFETNIAAAEVSPSQESEGNQKLHQIDKELDQLKDDPDDYNYDYGDPKGFDNIEKQFDNKLKEQLEIHTKSCEVGREGTVSSYPGQKYGVTKHQSKRLSPQRLPYKVHPYFPRPPPPFHHQPSFERKYSRGPQYYHHPGYPEHQQYPGETSRPGHGYYYNNHYNNNI